MAPTTILLVRHGETDWNRERRIQGQSDPPLNDLGREQSRTLAGRLASEEIDAIYSSDLRRARETAEILADELGQPVVLDPELRELDFGPWEGHTVDELHARFPEAFERWLAGGVAEWNGGETHDAMADRIRGAVRRLAATHAGESILLVAHGGPVRVLLMDAEGLPYPEARREFRRIANCDLSRIAVENGTVRRLD
jgi:2,3-bisphosphoglycerate-dependent phosphoglycerate mutase